MKRPLLLLALVLAGCSGTPATPGASTSPGASPSPGASAAPGTSATSATGSYDGATVLVDGAPATFQSTISTTVQGSADAKVHAYLIGFVNGQTQPVGTWAITVGYAKQGAGGYSFTVGLTQRKGAGLTDIASYNFSYVTVTGGSPFATPAGATFTVTEADNKLQAHMTAKQKAIIGGDVEHAFDATFKDLPL